MGFWWLRSPHRRWQEAASAYVDHELGDGALRRFESHLGGCPDCRKQVEGLRQAKALIAGLPEVAAPRSFRLTPAMLAEAAPEPLNAAPSWGFRGAALVAGVAAVALISVVAIDLSRSNGGSATHTAPASSESSRQGALSTTSGGAGAGTSAQDSAAPPQEPTPSPATKGIASPDIGGTGAQTLPTVTNASPAAGSTQPRAPVTGPAPGESPDITSSNAYAATVTPPGVLVPATGAPASENEGEPYRPLEAGLAALAIGATAGAVWMYRRKGRS